MIAAAELFAFVLVPLAVGLWAALHPADVHAGDVPRFGAPNLPDPAPTAGVSAESGLHVLDGQRSASSDQARPGSHSSLCEPGPATTHWTTAQLHRAANTTHTE